MFESITPVVLTYNEAPNIGRTLDRLSWASDVVVIDSFSEDATLDIIAAFPNARVFQRKFDCFANQWNYALSEIGIESEWVLALDADYLLTPELIEEIQFLKPSDDISGYAANFLYCINGHSLRGSAYPPVTVLFRRRKAQYRQDGHAYRVRVEGNVATLRSRMLHDDRKPLGHWLRSQDKYMQLEKRKLLESSWKDLGWADRLRKFRLVAPFAMFFYCLFVRGAILDGRAGIYYSFQRLLAESLLSLYLFEALFEEKKTADNEQAATLSID
jgi:glycosyltransferase involved in cell wall biosynthesis